TTTLQTGGSYPIGTPISALGSFTFVIPAGSTTIVGSATANGVLNDNPLQDDPLSISKSVSALVINPAITVAKTCQSVLARNPIPFVITVANTGDAPLSSVTCVDSKTGAVTVPTTLNAGQSATVTGSYTPTSNPDTNTVTCSGTDALGLTVKATASATCSV